MIVITAPSSTIGTELIVDLLDRGARLRLVARNPEKLAPDLHQRTEVIEGSHGNPAVIDRACKGAEAVFWLSPVLSDAPTIDASFADFARPACDAFTRHGVQRVVGISALGRGTALAANAGMVTASLAMDDLIASHVPYRAITCPSLMHNMLNHVSSIRDQGAFFMMMAPELRAPVVASRDVASTAARLLLDDSWSSFAEVPCLGPEDISASEMARTIAHVLGSPVRYGQVSAAQLAGRLTGFGFSDAMAKGMVEMFAAKNEGLDNAEPRTADSSTPTTFRQWCESVLEPAIRGSRLAS